MKNIYFFLIAFILYAQTASAYDTTSVRIFFEVNKYQLSDEEKQLLDDIIPSDTTIVLKGIRIYGYCDSVEKDGPKHNLSLNRAREVKNYLISKGLSKSLIMETEGKGKKVTVNNEPAQENRIALVLIEYEAKIVEQTIIIKSSPKMSNDQ
jgi:outer membrane protein OmpA-like peptidoglycan-associated protein